MQTLLVGRTTDVLKEAIMNLSKVTKEIGLAINLQKTKYMEVTKWPSNPRILKVDGQESERVRKLKYLGSTVTEDDDNAVEIKQRIATANPTIYGQKKHLSSRYLGRQIVLYIRRL
jgi:hypothetical protein